MKILNYLIFKSNMKNELKGMDVSYLKEKL